MRSRFGGHAAWLLFAVGACSTGAPSAKDTGAPTETDTDPPAGPTCGSVWLEAPGQGPQAPWVGVPIATTPALAAHPSGQRAVVVRVDADASWTLDGPFLASVDGAPPPAFWPGDGLARTLVLTATGDGDGTLSVTPGEGCPPTTLALHAVPPVRFAVRKLGGTPGVAPARVFHAAERVFVWLDPTVHADRAGLSMQVVAVPHRDADAWATDPTLPAESARGALTVDPAVAALDGAARMNPALTFTGPFLDAWDLVVDLDGDGTLSAGDLIDAGPERGAFEVTPDLSAPGPYTPVRSNRNDGGWLVQQVWYPAEIGTFTTPAPLVLLSHGNGHDYRWYDHFGAHLASWGLVFTSHRNNTQPGVEAASGTTLQNLNHFVQNHATWFDGRLAGKVDTHRISLVGHSRGGEGVVRAMQRVDAGFATQGWTAADVLHVTSIAPTVFLGVAASGPGSRPYHMLYGASDGDVTGSPDCDLCQALRLANAALGPVGVTYLHGASHNDFHNGGGWEDGVGPAQLEKAPVHAVAKATLAAAAGAYLLDIPAWKTWLTVNPWVLRPLGWPAEVSVAATWRDAPTDRIRILDAFQVETDVGRNDLGGAVIATVDNLVEAKMDDADAELAWYGNDPMNGMTVVERDGWERGAVFDWSTDASYATELPLGSGDLTGFEILSLRAAQGTRHPATAAHQGPMGFGIELEDGSGVAVTVPADLFGLVGLEYARTGYGAGQGYVNEFNTLRVPLAAFTAGATGLNLGDIRWVRLRFGAGFGAATGRLAIDDLYVGQEAR